MIENSIITGKVFTGTPSASNASPKRLYIKLLTGIFYYKAPRPKKAKVYGGELFVRYSEKEWPSKKNGPLLGDEVFLQGIGELLRQCNLENVSDIEYAKHQHPLKETLTLTVGSKLAKEIADMGWVHLME